MDVIEHSWEIREKVCLPCEARRGTQDDPMLPTTFCKEWYAACPYMKKRAAEVFPIDDSGDEVKIPDLDISIPKKIVEEYINHIVDRLRGRMVSEWEQENLLLRVRELEDTRRALHYAVKEHLGIEPYAVDTCTATIEALMEHYVEVRVRRFA